MVASLAGCESTAGSDDPDNGRRGNVRLANDNNFRSQSVLSIPTVETAPATDLDICWNSIERDLQCHDVSAREDLDSVSLLRFLHLSQEQVEDRLTSGQLAMAEVDGYLEYKTDHESTCAKLSALSFFGTRIKIAEEYRESDEHTYLLLFSVGTTPGVGARSMIFVKPTRRSTNTRVEASSSCGFLDFSAELSSLQKLPIPFAGPWVVDWRDVTLDSQGNDLLVEGIDGVVLGFYEGKTPRELQEQIFDLEQLATAIWEIKLKGGRTADLAEAKPRDGGGTFSGFERAAEGVWLLGLTCSTCQNPAPLVLTVLEPTDES